MNNIAKVLIGIGVVGVAAAATYVVVKKTEEKRHIDITPETTVEKKGDSFIDKIKAAAYKKAVRILAWVYLHKEKVEAFAMILSVAGAVFSVVNSIRELKDGFKMRQRMDSMYAHDMEFEDIWNKHINHQYDRHNEIMNKLNDIHLDMSMIHEINESLQKGA